MNDEIEVSISLPLDSDGFLRRECPTCEREFKWFHHEQGDPDAERTTQYFCPLCGVASGLDSWWTPAQCEYAEGSALTTSGAIELVHEAVRQEFKGMKGFTYTPDPTARLDVDVPGPLIEPDDMVIVEPPCHPSEPLKVPQPDTARVHCLVCGSAFTAA